MRAFKRLGLGRCGWRHIKNEHIYILPNGWVYSEGTVQHKTPRSVGGSNHPSNITLFCWHCNQADNTQFMNRIRESGAVLAIRKDMRAEGYLRRNALMQWADDGGPQPDERLSGGKVENPVPLVKVWKAMQREVLQAARAVAERRC